MKHLYQSLFLGFTFVGILFSAETISAETMNAEGVTYTYDFINKSKNEICITRAENVPREYSVPSKIGKYKVVRIGKSAFANSGIRKLKISGISLNNIGRFAFSNNEELQEVKFSGKYKNVYIGRDWFTDCPGARIVVPQKAKTLRVKVNANAGTLVIKGKNTELKGVKKLSNGKYYVQFEEVEVPASAKALKLLKKAYYGVINDSSEERYDSDSNNYSGSKLKKIKIRNVNSTRINIRRIVLKEDENCRLRILNLKTQKKVIWKSANKAVATVNEAGKVTAKKRGETKITAKVGKEKYTCIITVCSKIKLNQITINYNNDVFTEAIYKDNLRQITAQGEVKNVVTDAVAMKQIFAELASVKLEKSTQSVNDIAQGKYLSLYLEWDSGEKEVVLYENGYIGVKGVGMFQSDKNVYVQVKELVS